MAKIHKIVDEGFFESTTNQLVTCFGDTGEKAIYFRLTEHPEVMLVSTEPITDEAYMQWEVEEKKELWRL